MRVAHVIPYMHPSGGGPPVVVDRFCRGLSARGIGAELFTTDALAPPGDDGWRETFAGDYSATVSAARGGVYGFSPELRRVFRTRLPRFDLVHLHNLWHWPGWAAGRLCRRAGVPYVVNPHGMLDPGSLARKGWKKRTYGRLREWPHLRRARAMIYTADEERRLAEAAVAGLPPGMIVPLGADVPPDEPVGVLRDQFFRQFPLLRGRRVVLFLGRLHEKKGPDLLIEAFARIAELEPAASLVLVGAGSPDFVSQLRSRAGGLPGGLDRHVHFPGPLRGREKWAAYAAAEVFVLPSHQENFALTVAEAMGMRVPVVLSDRVNTWRDIVEAGAGAVCDVEPASIAGAVSTYLGDPDLRIAAGRAGASLVDERFNWPAAVDCLVESYDRILCRPVR